MGPPPPIPGLRYWSDSNTWEGSADALEAAGWEYQDNSVRMDLPLPDGATWRQYQTDGVLRVLTILRKHGGAILADDMGLGKTPQGAAIIKMLGGSALVVCPAGVRHQWDAWSEALTVVDKGQRCAVLGPISDKQFTKEWEDWKSGKATCAAVSYNLMDKALKQRIPRTIVFDEPHNYLQGRANTYVKTLWRFTKAIPYKLSLTGTPYLSKPSGLWQQLNILLGLTFGRAKEFDIRYCNGHQGEWGWDNGGATHTDELSKRLRHYMVRRMKADVATELPKVTRTVRWVDADTKATAALANAQHSITGLRGAVRSTLDGKGHDLRYIVTQADRAGRATVTFTWLRETAHEIHKGLVDAGFNAVCVTGEDTAAERANMIAAAYTSRAHVVTTYGASGQGLDGLQRWISDSIFHAIDPVPAILLQAGARLDRIGQTLPVTETYLAMRDSVDEITVDSVINRLDTWQSVMGKDKSSAAVRAAMVRGGMDPNADDVLDAIFKEMTK